jgi:hypothetical protein
VGTLRVVPGLVFGLITLSNFINLVHHIRTDPDQLDFGMVPLSTGFKSLSHLFDLWRPAAHLYTLFVGYPYKTDTSASK